MGIATVLLLIFAMFYGLAYLLFHSILAGVVSGSLAVLLFAVLSEPLWKRTLGRADQR